MPADDLKADLARDVRFALRLKVTAGSTRKLIRALGEKAVDNLAADIADHLLLCGWHHRPRSETDFSGPSLMSGSRRSAPWPKGGDED